eukprot:CAMPEP_0119469936 /NCGR_PEP_ID=MMETSP1344-20130328/3048_1 /TAXON_ID=236787 /ORGANISM="Florenciella parvula, Strain CCMP2471" /LENGTH=289 /DNA_ID=CAMNT_0007502547 /DNA_START=111 /DNA_END=980 /DNA_ORIENTATION=+
MGNKLNCLANDPEANPPPKGRPIECADPGEEEPNPVAEKEEEKEEAPKGADAAAGTAPSKIRLLVCNNFQIDITADGFGICKCGHEKSAHSFPKDGQVCQPAEADNRKGLFETVAGAVACRNDDEPQEEQSESRVSILQKSLKSQVEDEYISEERGSTRQREEAKKLKETVKAESRASVWAERASLHTANQGILQGTIEKEKRLSVQVNTVASSEQRDEAKNLANVMNSEYNIGGADKRKEMWKEREEEHRKKQGVIQGEMSTPAVEAARQKAKQKRFDSKRSAFEQQP